MEAAVTRDAEKRAAALAAVAEVQDGMLVGLGTGSTAALAIVALGDQIAQGLKITAVATSIATEAAARAAGILVIDMAGVSHIDLTIDGADEIDRRLFAIKGAGGAMLREKVVAAASRRMVVIADSSKSVARIGAAAVPVEVLPFAAGYVGKQLFDLGATVVPRAGFVSNQGNPILDCRFADLSDPERVAAAIQAIPGALGHGLFLTEVDAAYIANGEVVTRLERGEASG